MNRPETAKVLAVMTAAWPSFDMTDATAHLWAEMLETVPLDRGLAAARRCIRQSNYFPSISYFLDVADACREQTEYHALSGPSVRTADKDFVDEKLALMRLRIDMGTRGHKHDGPNPCPVCGGVRPGERTKGEAQ